MVLQGLIRFTCFTASHCFTTVYIHCFTSAWALAVPVFCPPLLAPQWLQEIISHTVTRETFETVKTCNVFNQFSVFAVWCVHVASLNDSTLRFLVAARPDSAPWLSTINPWDDSWGSSLEGFSLAESSFKQSGRSAFVFEINWNHTMGNPAGSLGRLAMDSRHVILLSKAQWRQSFRPQDPRAEVDLTRWGQAMEIWLTLIPQSAQRLQNLQITSGSKS